MTVVPGQPLPSVMLTVEEPELGHVNKAATVLSPRPGHVPMDNVVKGVFTNVIRINPVIIDHCHLITCKANIYRCQSHLWYIKNKTLKPKKLNIFVPLQPLYLKPNSTLKELFQIRLPL